MTHSRNLVLTTVAALISASAMAQTAATATSATASAADSGVLEEVTITAQKRTEKLQDIPVSAAVLSSDTISNMNAADISDINRLVPSVNLNGSINGRVPMGIRGISTVQSEFNVGLASGVAVLIDGVPVPSDSRAANALVDIQSVEVLKGPQATLGGRTAAQGVINIVTRQPTDAPSGSFSLEQTNDGETEANAFISGPLASKLDGSLTAYYIDHTFPINNLTLDQKTQEKVFGARGKLLFKPTDDLDIKLTGRIGHDDSSGMNFVYTHLVPGVCLLIGACPPPGTPGFPLGGLEQNVLLPGITPSFNNLNYASPVHAFSNVNDAEGSVDISWRFNGLTLQSTTALQHEEQVNVQDLFTVNDYFWNILSGAPGSGAPPFNNTQTQNIDVRQLSEELKLVSPANETFSYVVGLFYSDTQVSMQLSRPLLPALENYTAAPDTKKTALYGRGTWKLSPENILVGGLRYNYDQLSYTYNQYAYDASFPPPNIVGPVNASGSNSQSTAVGDISYQHYFAPEQMVYGSYSRGYAPAVYNMAKNLLFQGDVVNLAPKTDIDAFEVGTKGTYLQHRLTVNADVFYTKYKNFQAQAIVPNGSVNPPSQLVKADAVTKGVEVDVVAAPTSHLRLTADLAYIDAHFTSFPGDPCYYTDTVGQLVPSSICQNGVHTQTSGLPMPNSPKWKYTLGAEQRFPISNGAELLAGAEYSYRGSAQMLADQSPDGVMPAVGILNLNVGIDFPHEKLKLTIFGNNILNKVYYTDLEDFWSGPWGGTSAVVGQPARDAHRYFGARLNYSF